MLLKWWQKRVAEGSSTAKVINDFFAKGIDLKTAEEIVFDELAAKLSNEELMDAMGNACRR
eukprot:3908902-Rhodomonas_salina.1